MSYYRNERRDVDIDIDIHRDVHIEDYRGDYYGYGERRSRYNGCGRYYPYGRRNGCCGYARRLFR